MPPEDMRLFFESRGHIADISEVPLTTVMGCMVGAIMSMKYRHLKHEGHKILLAISSRFPSYLISNMAKYQKEAWVCDKTQNRHLASPNLSIIICSYTSVQDNQ
jgi:hypothetical protein